MVRVKGKLFLGPRYAGDKFLIDPQFFKLNMARHVKNIWI